MIRRWWVWMVAMSSASENVMTVSPSGAVRDKLAPLSCACEHVFGVTSKGSITGQLQRALAKRDVLAVRSLAGKLPSVPLPIAAQNHAAVTGARTRVLCSGGAATSWPPCI
jgi:hypothetical protein